MADIGIAAPAQVAFGVNAATMPVQTFSLPPLPYAYNALEPQISAEIMTLHHDRHHQAYVTNLNAALVKYTEAAASGNLADQLALQSVIRFNGGGHLNHALFWPSLAPAASADASKRERKAPKLTTALKNTYGSVSAFTDAFSKALLSIQGSGWGWLVKTGGEYGTAGLRIVTTKDQDPVTGDDTVPLLGIDMWEHAYYPQYQNGKQSYVENVWNIINWTTVEARYTGSQNAAYGVINVVLST